MAERVKREWIKNMRPAIIFAFTLAGCSKYTSLLRMRTHIYVKKIFLFNFGGSRDDNFAGNHFCSLHAREIILRVSSVMRRDVAFSMSRRAINKLLPLSIWWIIAPFIASVLASNRRSSSFSFLPKKTIVTTFSFMPRSGTWDSFQSSRF